MTPDNNVYSFCFLLFLLSYTGYSQQVEDSELIAATPSVKIIRERNFRMTAVDGRQMNLNELLQENKPVVINFFASWCMPCRKEIPHLVSSYNAYKDSVLFIGITIETPAKASAAINKMIEKYEMNYPVVFASDTVYKFLCNEGNKMAFPRLLIYDRDGKLFTRFGKWYGTKTIKAQQKAFRKLMYSEMQE